MVEDFISLDSIIDQNGDGSYDHSKIEAYKGSYKGNKKDP